MTITALLFLTSSLGKKERQLADDEGMTGDEL
jgi:hypothetical protein